MLEITIQTSEQFVSIESLQQAVQKIYELRTDFPVLNIQAQL